MKLIVGLGNPDLQYRGTRHNVGFEVVESLAERLGATGRWRRDFSSELLEVADGQQRLLLVKPQTYMNRSGLAVAGLVNFFQVPLADLLVVCDDLNLPLGQLRLRAQGSHGGHKGLLDIQRQLGTTTYPRLRIGIGSPPAGQDAADYVLQKFRQEERPIIQEAIDRATEAVMVWVREGIEAAMNRFNVRQAHPVQGNEEQPRIRSD
jgi:PTH1 family peptidyl-tRNA hydrolase